jgi:hypothetical protein
MTSADPSAPPLEKSDSFKDLSNIPEDMDYRSSFAGSANSGKNSGPRSHLYPDLDNDPSPYPSTSQRHRGNHGDQRYEDYDTPYPNPGRTAQPPPPRYPSRQGQGREKIDPVNRFIFDASYNIVMAPLYGVWYLLKWLVKWLILTPLLAPYYMAKRWYYRATYLFDAGIYFYPSLIRFALWIWEKATGRHVSSEWDEYRHQYYYGVRDEQGRMQKIEADFSTIMKNAASALLWVLTAGYVGQSHQFTTQGYSARRPTNPRLNVRPTPTQNRYEPYGTYPTQNGNSMPSTQDGLYSWIKWIYRGGIPSAIYQQLNGRSSNPGPYVQEPADYPDDPPPPYADQYRDFEETEEMNTGQDNTSFYLNLIIFGVCAFMFYHFYQLMFNGGD